MFLKEGTIETGIVQVRRVTVLFCDFYVRNFTKNNIERK